MYLHFLNSGDPVNMKNWVVIGHICNKDSLIRMDNVVNIIGQNIINQSGSRSSYCGGSGD